MESEDLLFATHQRFALRGQKSGSAKNRDGIAVRLIFALEGMDEGACAVRPSVFLKILPGFSEGFFCARIFPETIGSVGWRPRTKRN
ncbi:MAG: hypothetical protein QM796_14925 [Chthoniobacteraceae bacterium]